METYFAIAVIVSIAIYFLPSIVASGREHKNFAAILVINLFLGWTIVGWVVALAMAFSYQAPEPQAAQD